jgi:hypothetical protein
MIQRLRTKPSVGTRDNSAIGAAITEVKLVQSEAPAAEPVQTRVRRICYTDGNSPQPSEVLMNDSLVTLSWPAIPPQVQEFAADQGVSGYLDAVIDLARQDFPSSALCVSLGQDAEDEMHQYVALDVEAGGRAAEELLAGQRIWSAGVGHVCPSRHAVYFVLGWR